MKDRLGTCWLNEIGHGGLHEKSDRCSEWREEPAQREGATCPTCKSKWRGSRNCTKRHPNGMHLDHDEDCVYCSDHWHGAAHTEGGEKPLTQERAERAESAEAELERVRVALREIEALPLGHHDAKKLARAALSSTVKEAK